MKKMKKDAWQVKVGRRETEEENETQVGRGRGALGTKTTPNILFASSHQHFYWHGGKAEHCILERAARW